MILLEPYKVVYEPGRVRTVRCYWRLGAHETSIVIPEHQWRRGRRVFCMRARAELEGRQVAAGGVVKRWLACAADLERAAAALRKLAAEHGEHTPKVPAKPRASARRWEQ